ncbi:DUF1801 domain-containing protein [Fretibacter rubidus]|uniref:DUF1801 domain-containing protein n=1 Tax=Fretibacter rubidus TaxID=570162 RepID=UPI00352A235B
MSFTAPPIAAPVAAVINRYPEKARQYALALRALIFNAAQNDPRVGPLTETLKWREPSYLTEHSGSGTTLRYDWKDKRPDAIGLFVSCQTTLIPSFRDLFSDVLTFEGNRAIWLNTDQPLPRDILAICIGRTFTYHLDKG